MLKQLHVLASSCHSTSHSNFSTCGDGSGGGVCGGGGVCVCVLTHTCVHVHTHAHGNVCACIWRPEIDEGCLSPLLSTSLFESGYFSEPGAH